MHVNVWGSLDYKILISNTMHRLVVAYPTPPPPPSIGGDAAAAAAAVAGAGAGGAAASAVPYQFIAWWRTIFRFVLDPEDTFTVLQLRPQCKLFAAALPDPPPLYATFPHPAFPSLEALFARMNARARMSDAFPRVLVLAEGEHTVQRATRVLEVQGFPLRIVGAGAERTAIVGAGLKAVPVHPESSRRWRRSGVTFALRNLTVRGAPATGVKVDSMSTSSGRRNPDVLEEAVALRMSKVVVSGAGGIGVEVVGGCALLDNVVVERSAGSGVVAARALVLLRGAETRVVHNVTAGSDSSFGLKTQRNEHPSRVLFSVGPALAAVEGFCAHNGGGGDRGAPSDRFGGGRVASVALDNGDWEAQVVAVERARLEAAEARLTLPVAEVAWGESDEEKVARLAALLARSTVSDAVQ